MPTSGRVIAARLAPMPSIAAQVPKRNVINGTRKNAAAQTGLNANRPQTSPPRIGRSLAISAQPQVAMASDREGLRELAGRSAAAASRYTRETQARLVLEVIERAARLRS